MKVCKSCGSEGECFFDCGCAKCRNPEGYAKWKANDPDGYADWLETQLEWEDTNG